jgi:hypothetical protein
MYAAIIWIGVLNFVAFVIIAMNIGGDALNGYEDSGRFYLSSHGRPVEVPEALSGTAMLMPLVSGLLIQPC